MNLPGAWSPGLAAARIWTSIRLASEALQPRAAKACGGSESGLQGWCKVPGACLQGFWGLCISAVALPLLTFYKGPDGKPFDDAMGAWREIAGSASLQISVAASIVSIAFFNYFGITVRDCSVQIVRYHSVAGLLVGLALFGQTRSVWYLHLVLASSSACRCLHAPQELDIPLVKAKILFVKSVSEQCNLHR